MNYAFKIIIALIITNHASAKLINIQYEQDNLKEAKSIQEIFISQYNIPHSLISISKTESCQSSTSHLCINSLKSLEINVKKPDDLRKSLSSFNIKKEGL